MKFYLRNVLCLLNENACLPNPTSGSFAGKEYQSPIPLHYRRG